MELAAVSPGGVFHKSRLRDRSTPLSTLCAVHLANDNRATDQSLRQKGLILVHGKDALGNPLNNRQNKEYAISEKGKVWWETIKARIEAR